jgi:hypothetical protein
MSKKLYMVETVSTFHLRYLVEAESAEDAAFDVKNNTPEIEFSQRHIGEEVLFAHKIKESKAVSEFRKDNEYLSEWSDELIKSKMVSASKPLDDLFGSI